MTYNMSAPTETRAHPVYKIQDFRDASPKQGNNPEHFSFQEHGFQNLNQADCQASHRFIQICEGPVFLSMHISY